MRTLVLPAPLTTGDHRVAEDEAHHAISVLRVSPGDALRVADGDGREGDAVVVAVERKSLVLRIDAVRVLPAAPAERLTVAVALPKGDRAGDLVRGLTELGVGAILPLRCNRGLRDAAPARLERIAAEALKLTPTQLFEQLHSGKTLEEIAEAQGVELQTVVDAMNAERIQAMKDQIAQAVADGKITQAQADWMLEGIEKGYMPMGRGGFGKFGGPGRGHGRGGWQAPSTPSTHLGPTPVPVKAPPAVALDEVT